MRVLLIGLCVALAACGTNPAERNNAGNWLSTQGDYAQAVRAYEAAQVADPDNALLYFNSAQALARDAQIEAANAALQQAIQRGDEALVADAYYNLGNLYFEQGAFALAVNAYQQVLLLRPEDNAARFNLELALANLERPTPTAQQMQSEPDEQQANPSATPSPNPGGRDQPPPTPSPPPDAPDGPEREDLAEGGEPGDDPRTTPLPMQGNLSVEAAEQVLLPIQFEQDSIGGLPDPLVTPGTPTSGKDW